MCGSDLTQVPSSAADAMAMVKAGLAWLARSDAGSLPGAVQADCLRGLEQAEAMTVAARSAVLATFSAQGGAGRHRPRPPLPLPRLRPAPAACQPHHIIPRSEAGPTSLANLILTCSFHHLIAVHRWGWGITLHPDGTLTATSPDDHTTLHDHGPPAHPA